jgi:tetratricopeptide (TPR) repeat protein
MRTALDRTDPNEVEDRAWLLVQIGHLELLSADTRRAEQALEDALALVPDYHYALGGLARVRAAQGRHAEAATLQRRRAAVAPHPENLYELGAALASSGQRADAREVFARFERMARAEMDSDDNANRELALYYVDHAPRPKEALRIAAREAARRPTVSLRAAHAWALLANGRRAEARRVIEAVLAVGTVDPDVLRCAKAMDVRRDGKAAVTASR